MASSIFVLWNPLVGTKILPLFAQVGDFFFREQFVRSSLQLAHVRPAEPEDAEEEEQTEARDGVAETLIRWVPPLTAILCAGIALWGFVYYQFMM